MHKRQKSLQQNDTLLDTCGGGGGSSSINVIDYSYPGNLFLKQFFS